MGILQSITIGMNPNLIDAGGFVLSWHGLLTFVAVATAVFLVARWGGREGLVVDLPLSALNKQIYEQMEFLEPFGPGNPEPIFRIQNTVITEVKFMSGGLHAQITLQGNRTVRGVLWNRGGLIQTMILQSGQESEARGTVSGLQIPVDWILGTLEADVFRGGKKRSKFQFVIQDLDSPLFKNSEESAATAGAKTVSAVNAG